MTFSVDTARLRGLPKLLDRAGDDAHSSALYLRKHDDLAWQSDFGIWSVGTLIALLKPHHDRIVDLVDGHLTSRLRDAIHGDADRVTDAIAYYERTDTAAAARADRLLPGASRPELLPTRPAPTTQTPAFTDTVEPTARLVTPADHSGDLPHPIPEIKAGNFSGTVRELVWRLTELGTQLGLCDRPYDIFEEMVRPVVGDWPALHACADVFRNIGATCTDVGENLAANQLAIGWAWSGNASNACREHLAGLGGSLRATDARLQEIAASYDRLARDVSVLCQRLAEVLADLTDLAILALIEAEAAAASVPTAIGPIIFGSATAYHFYRFYKALQIGFELAQAISVLVHEFAAELGTFSRLDDPNGLPVVPVPPALPA